MNTKKLEATKQKRTRQRSSTGWRRFSIYSKCFLCRLISWKKWNAFCEDFSSGRNAMIYLQNSQLEEFLHLQFLCNRLPWYHTTSIKHWMWTLLQPIPQWDRLTLTSWMVSGQGKQKKQETCHLRQLMAIENVKQLWHRFWFNFNHGWCSCSLASLFATLHKPFLLQW
jgi:hypothetical protein